MGAQGHSKQQSQWKVQVSIQCHIELNAVSNRSKKGVKRSQLQSEDSSIISIKPFPLSACRLENIKFISEGGKGAMHRSDDTICEKQKNHFPLGHPITVKNRTTGLLQRIGKYYCMPKYSRSLRILRFYANEHPLGSNLWFFLHQCNYGS